MPFPANFQGGWNRKGFTESDIRYAMENTNSCAEAARFLNVTLQTYRKYAKMFIDRESGKSLYELHKNPPNKGMSKMSLPRHESRWAIRKILAGEANNYNGRNFKQKLIRSGLIAECCDLCGYDERRLSDGTIPLIVDFLDGDHKHYALDNVRLLCYNCFYNNIGNPFGRNENKIGNGEVPEWWGRGYYDNFNVSDPFKANPNYNAGKQEDAD
jgi:hypothetical protein